MSKPRYHIRHMPAGHLWSVYGFGSHLSGGRRSPVWGVRSLVSCLSLFPLGAAQGVTQGSSGFVGASRRTLDPLSFCCYLLHLDHIGRPTDTPGHPRRVPGGAKGSRVVQGPKGVPRGSRGSEGSPKGDPWGPSGRKPCCVFPYWSRMCPYVSVWVNMVHTGPYGSIRVHTGPWPGRQARQAVVAWPATWTCVYG